MLLRWRNRRPDIRPVDDDEAQAAQHHHARA
jgi:hypothetical protein